MRAADGEHELALLDRREIAQRDGRQLFGVDLQDREVRFLVHAHHARLVDALLHRLPARLRRAGRRQQDEEALGTLDDVRVGDDVAGRVDDDPGANPALARDEGSLGVALVAGGGSVARDDDLHHCWRHLVGELRHGVAELPQRTRCVGASRSVKEQCKGRGDCGACLHTRLAEPSTAAVRPCDWESKARAGSHLLSKGDRDGACVAAVKPWPHWPSNLPGQRAMVDCEPRPRTETGRSCSADDAAREKPEHRAQSGLSTAPRAQRSSREGD